MVEPGYRENISSHRKVGGAGGYEWEKKIDFGANGLLGYYTRSAKVFPRPRRPCGYNLSKIHSQKLKMNRDYDIDSN